ncbi:tail tape-measure protein [Edaphobacter modestus]|uniref:Tail tape-measure protein n=2 Tax=Edaphobacter modestus TaxID=388466 RepID=A0A4V2G424_9BACT|nr:tail tape-measure protein [Edaphobacter modestus]
MPAGNVQVVLSVDKATYSQAMTEAQRQLDSFAGKARTAGHSTVSSMQAASASIRLLENPMSANIRAIERLISQSQVLSGVLKAAFPVVGAVMLGEMFLKLGTEVAEFVKKANDMPKAIGQGFNSLHLSSQAATDALKLTNDQLQNHIDKLQGKTQNNLAIQLDETRIKADELAKSLEQDANKVKELLSQNKLTGLAGLLTGQAGTGSVSGSVSYGMNEIQHLAYLNRQAVGTPGAAQAQKNLADKQEYYRKYAQNQLFIRNHPEYATDESTQDMAGDQTANKAILTGFLDVLNDQQASQAEKNRNAALVPKNQQAEVNSAAAKKQADEFRKQLEIDQELWNKAQELERNMAQFSTQYLDEFYKTNGLSTADNTSLTAAGKASNERIQALREAIDLQKQFSDAQAESSIQMQAATGNMTKLDAAQAMVNLHTSQYNDAIAQLQAQRQGITTDKRYGDNDEARQAALQRNQNQMDSLNASRTIQVAQDNVQANPQASSALVGAKDALDDFVLASKDAASQMRNITESILGGLNQQLVAGLSGQRTNFGNFGAGVFRSVAGAGLTHLEGSALGALGFGSSAKLGTQENPMYVRIADKVSGAVSAAGGMLGKLFGGSSSSSGSNDQGGGGMDTISSVLTDTIPFLASGGPINGPAIVGEAGPELFNPGTSGTIIPNHKLSSVLPTSAGHTFNIDARGATDPAQVQVAVNRAIQQAAPQIMAGSVHAMNERTKRRPSTVR